MISKETRGHLAAFDQRTGALQPWAPTIGVHGVLALHVTADAVLVAGQLHKVSGVVAQGFARFTTDGADPRPTTTTTRPAVSTTTSRPAVTTTTSTAPTTATTTVPASSVGVTTARTGPARSGYWIVGADGTVYPFGDARSYGKATLPAGAGAVDLEPTPSGEGYWIIDSRGTVYPFGDAPASTASVPSGGRWGERHERVGHTDWQGLLDLHHPRRVVPVGDAVFLGDMSAVALNGPVLDSPPHPARATI